MYFQLLQWTVNWDNFITFPLFLIFNVTALCRDGGEWVLLRGTVHAQTTLLHVLHIPVSAHWQCGVLDPERGLFRACTAASSGCVCQRRNLGMCFLNKQERERKRRGQQELLEGGSGLSVLCLHCPEIPPVCAFITAIEPGAFRHYRAVKHLLAWHQMQ